MGLGSRVEGWEQMETLLACWKNESKVFSHCGIDNTKVAISNPKMGHFNYHESVVIVIHPRSRQPPRATTTESPVLFRFPFWCLALAFLSPRQAFFAVVIATNSLFIGITIEWEARERSFTLPSSLFLVQTLDPNPV